jgi:hypothetical protein
MNVRFKKFLFSQGSLAEIMSWQNCFGGTEMNSGPLAC